MIHWVRRLVAYARAEESVSMQSGEVGNEASLLAVRRYWLGYVIGLMHCSSSSRSCLFALQCSALLEPYSTFGDFALSGTDLYQRHVQRRLSLGRNAVLRALPQHPQ